MSLNKVRQVKTDKGFKIWDLIIYGIIIVLVAALLIAVFVGKDDSPLSGIKIYVDKEIVLEYDFSSKPKPLREDIVKVEEGENSITLTITTENGYNVIYIDKNEKSVKVTEADCRGKQCMYMSIKDNSGIITCDAHKLVIKPFDFDPDGIIV